LCFDHTMQQTHYDTSVNVPPGLGIIPPPNPLLSGQWLPLETVFQMGDVDDAYSIEPRLWEYLGIDNAIHGPFSSLQMNNWNQQGFFHGKELRLRLIVQKNRNIPAPPPPRPISKPPNTIHSQPLSLNQNVLQPDKESSKSQENSNRIFIGGLCQEVSDENILEHFSKFGTISNHKIFREKRFAFVAYNEESKGAKERAIAYYPHLINEKKINVQKADSNKSSSSSPSSNKSNSDKDQSKNVNFRLYIGSLEFKVTSLMLKEYIMKFGKVTNIIIKTDPATQKSKGYGFVTMSDRDGYNAVLCEPNHILNDKKFIVKPADPSSINHGSSASVPLSTTHGTGGKGKRYEAEWSVPVPGMGTGGNGKGYEAVPMHGGKGMGIDHQRSSVVTRGMGGLPDDDYVSKRKNASNSPYVLYIGNLPKTMSTEALIAYFSNFGQVLHGNIVYSNTTSVSNVYGFITMQNENDFNLILSRNHYINNCQVSVQISNQESSKKTKIPYLN